MKEFVIKLCSEEFGHLTILAAFDCVDDTVLVKKALVQVSETPISKKTRAWSVGDSSSYI